MPHSRAVLRQSEVALSNSRVVLMRREVAMPHHRAVLAQSEVALPHSRVVLMRRGRNTPEPGGDAVWLSFPNAMRIINPWISTCGFMSSCDILGLCDPAKCFHAAFLHFARSQSPKMRHFHAFRGRKTFSCDILAFCGVAKP